MRKYLPDFEFHAYFDGPACLMFITTISFQEKKLRIFAKEEFNKKNGANLRRSSVLKCWHIQVSKRTRVTVEMAGGSAERRPKQGAVGSKRVVPDLWESFSSGGFSIIFPSGHSFITSLTFED